MKNLFNKIWNWIKNLFISWYTKEIDNKVMIDYFENIIANLDMNKNGKTSLKEVINYIKDLIK